MTDMVGASGAFGNFEERTTIIRNSNSKMLQGKCIVVNNYKLLSQTAEKRGKESSFEKKKVS